MHPDEAFVPSWSELHGLKRDAHALCRSSTSPWIGRLYSDAPRQLWDRDVEHRRIQVFGRNYRRPTLPRRLEKVLPPYLSCLVERAAQYVRKELGLEVDLTQGIIQEYLAGAVMASLILHCALLRV